MMKRSTGLAISILLIVFLAILTVKCTHKSHIFPTPGNKDTTQTPVDTGNHAKTDTGICFERDILPIFISNCTNAGCHDSITHAGDYQLNNYANIVAKGISRGNASGSHLIQVLAPGDDQMPPATLLSSAQIYLLSKWINEGALDSGNCSSNICDTNNYTYSGAIRSLISLYCVGCHNSISGPAGNLADYNTLQIIALNGRLLGDISHLPGFNAMPKGSLQLSDCQVTQVKKWIDGGALNN